MNVQDSALAYTISVLQTSGRRKDPGGHCIDCVDKELCHKPNKHNSELLAESETKKHY